MEEKSSLSSASLAFDAGDYLIDEFSTIATESYNFLFIRVSQ